MTLTLALALALALTPEGGQGEVMGASPPFTTPNRPTWTPPPTDPPDRPPPPPSPLPEPPSNAPPPPPPPPPLGAFGPLLLGGGVASKSEGTAPPCMYCACPGTIARRTPARDVVLPSVAAGVSVRHARSPRFAASRGALPEHPPDRHGGPLFACRTVCQVATAAHGLQPTGATGLALVECGSHSTPLHPPPSPPQNNPGLLPTLLNGCP